MSHLLIGLLGFARRHSAFSISTVLNVSSCFAVNLPFRSVRFGSTSGCFSSSFHEKREQPLNMVASELIEEANDFTSPSTLFTLLSWQP